jgi:uncharacterized protein (DUF952 family)
MTDVNRDSQAATDSLAVYKILRPEEWSTFQMMESWPGAPVDLADGFVHLSTADQAPETAAKHFAGESDLRLVAFDSAALGDALRWEPSRGGALFPHLHAPLPRAAALWDAPLPLGPDGRHVFPEGFGAAPE